MEPPSLLISWVNPFPSRFVNKTIFFRNALESHECACCLLSFLYFHWLFPLSARETSPRNQSIYKSARERVDSKGLYGRCRLHLMGSCTNLKKGVVVNLPPGNLQNVNHVRILTGNLKLAKFQRNRWNELYHPCFVISQKDWAIAPFSLCTLILPDNMGHVVRISQ